ncbi:Molybdenum cofactor guanylyltransferase [Polaribacter huanghezhanensis]|uniref:nucleotidyltransferase family protein n=1 Tax=Polaribacter huanghezhanensis TaxID=1354726 RepID=UPI002648A80D|nr:NTP transferase domain-containing protein [Polaribacter huanghezhanensis]WKD84815.1 Molybdenum cofactor guanylyltransferase [Polaribacter huanghezhanensis]
MKKETVLIILAGGKSSRMDFPKGLLKHKNHFWILSQMESFIGEKITIGLGFDYQLYFDAIPWLAKAVEKPQNYQQKIVHVVINKTPEFGLFSTVQSVLKTLDTNHQAVILPIDVPLLKSSELKKIIDTENEIVIPTYNNKNGHPVKLAPKFWKSLLELNITDKNSRLDLQIKKRNASKISLVEINDASILKNLNTPKDWQAFTS